MRKVSSPTFAGPRWTRLIVTGVVTLGLLCGGVQASYAKSLDDQRKEVRKAMVTAKSNVKDSEKAVKDATAKLADSQDKLERAQATLTQMQSDLSAAKDQQATIAAALAQARADLAKAEAAATQAAANVEAQRELIGIAARTQYQQQTDLVGLAVAFGAETPADLAQRLQWSTTIFDSTAAAYERLQTLEDQLATAEQQKAAAEKAVAAQDKAAKAQVAAVQKLTNDAAKQASDVAALVGENAKAKKNAQAALEEDQKQYDALAKKNAEISAAIKKAAEEEARRAAAAKKSVPSSSGADNQPITTPDGFVRPVPGSVGSAFGMRFHPILHRWRMHWGEDLHAGCGTPLRAMANGKVTSTIPARSSGGLGNYTVISYGVFNGKALSSGYAHQSKFLVSAGERVTAGQIVGLVGTTGLSTGCHLHLQIYENGRLVNPAKYVP